MGRTFVYEADPLFLQRFLQRLSCSETCIRTKTIRRAVEYTVSLQNEFYCICPDRYIDSCASLSRVSLKIATTWVQITSLFPAVNTRRRCDWSQWATQERDWRDLLLFLQTLRGCFRRWSGWCRLCGLLSNGNHLRVYTSEKYVSSAITHLLLRVRDLLSVLGGKGNQHFFWGEPEIRNIFSGEAKKRRRGINREDEAGQASFSSFIHLPETPIFDRHVEQGVWLSEGMPKRVSQPATKSELKRACFETVQCHDSTTLNFHYATLKNHCP